jgi:hypothetical protein
MITKLALITNIALSYNISERAESLKIPFMSLTVGESVPASVLYAPIIVCDSLVITKKTPLDILTRCAVGRPGWIKL